jgi:hypothetical protein
MHDRDTQHVERVWPDPVEGWQTLSRNAKLFAVYRSAKEERPLDVLAVRRLGESDPIVCSALLLYWAKKNSAHRKAAFRRAHKLLQDHVLDTAFKTHRRPALEAYLPLCERSDVGVRHCEGRTWGEGVFCPRLGREGGPFPCRHLTCKRPRRGESLPTWLPDGRWFGSGTREEANKLGVSPKEVQHADAFDKPGCVTVPDIRRYAAWRNRLPVGSLAGDDRTFQGYARLRPVPEQDWHDWSILELLDWAGVTPELDELRHSSAYVPKLCGWVNRLCEITRHLQCSVCNGGMVPHFRYATNLARYNVTVVSCPKGGSHDQNVYLNHCWACHKVVDSRKSPLRREGYYLCTACGSGNRESTTYSQGDLCPACGRKDMKKSRYEPGEMYCSGYRNGCKHVIRLPIRSNLTGPRWNQTVEEKMEAAFQALDELAESSSPGDGDDDAGSRDAALVRRSS